MIDPNIIVLSIIFIIGFVSEIINNKIRERKINKMDAQWQYISNEFERLIDDKMKANLSICDLVMLKNEVLDLHIEALKSI